jgi:EAL domain-containing protein (putative c-di-GMP-specific phosphodiesterase class I)/CheY-like chemotaxis protein
MLRILIVDDDPDVRHMLKLMLQRSGDEVDEAEDGAEALRKAIKNSYDAAIVDFRMPPPDGLEVLTRLRDTQPRCVRILMSGALDLPMVMNAINRGEVSRVVQKPFSRQAILAAVSESIATRTRLEEICVGALGESRESQRRQLEECLAGNILTLSLQPIVRAHDGGLRGYEALLRSSHPMLDTPQRVLSAAEAHDMIDRVADRVANCARQWFAKLPDDVDLFLNLHPAELSDLGRVRGRLEGLQQWSRRVILEITERSDVLQMDGWRNTLDFITGSGFRFAVDDVGCGYNSLAVLAELRPAFMKVDRVIVRYIEHDAHKQRLLELLSVFARATGTQLVVEGIETETEAETVRRIGADLLQGYLFGRPASSLSQGATQLKFAESSMLP